jgi:hypothetical protein
MTTLDHPIESQVDHLFLIFTERDLRDRGEYDRWRAQLADIAGTELHWGQRFAVDPDQRRGESPSWPYLAIAGTWGGKPAFESVRTRLSGLESAGEIAIWEYEAVGRFVRQSYGLPGSPVKTVLAPGAYRTSHETENGR